LECNRYGENRRRAVLSDVCFSPSISAAAVFFRHIEIMESARLRLRVDLFRNLEAQRPGLLDRILDRFIFSATKAPTVSMSRRWLSLRTNSMAQISIDGRCQSAEFTEPFVRYGFFFVSAWAMLRRPS
jgi:hypothetical protein